MAHRLNEIAILSYNHRAMDHLRNKEYEICYSYLSKAENLLGCGKLSTFSKLYGTTLNNFACYYRRLGKYALALNFLRKGLEVLSRPPVDIKSLGGTYLNICAILSETGDHINALPNAFKAVNLLSTHFSEDPTIVSTLLVAYNNAGLECEFLSKFAEATTLYGRAARIAFDNLGENHPLSISLRNSLRGITGEQRFKSVKRNKNALAEGASCNRTSQSRSRASGSRSIHSSLNDQEKGFYRLDKLLNEPEKSEKETRRVVREQEKTFKPTEGGIRESGKNEKFLESSAKKMRFLTGERIQPMHGKQDNLKIKIVYAGGRYKSRSSRHEESSTEHTVYRDQKTSTGHLEEIEKYGVNKAVQVSDGQENDLSVRIDAAICIQKGWRRYKAKKIVETLRYRRDLALAEIEARNAIEKLTILKNKGNKAKITGSSLIKRENKSYEINKKISIGNRERNYNTKRKNLRADLKEKYILLIQKHARGWIQRRRYLRVINACIIVQKHIRRYQIYKLYCKIREAAIYIQKFWKNHLIPNQKINSTKN